MDPHLAKHLAHFGIDMLHMHGVRMSAFVSVPILWGGNCLFYLIYNFSNMNLHFTGFSVCIYFLNVIHWHFLLVASLDFLML